MAQRSKALAQSEIDTLMSKLWQDYTERLCPSAAHIQHIFQQSSPIINDHIALRTFALPALGLPVLARPFEDVGYQAKGEYRFKQKHLYARHYEHPNPANPKIFISELCLDTCSVKLKNMVQALVKKVSFASQKKNDFL